MLFFDFAYGFDDTAGFGDGFENGLEYFFGLGFIAFKLNVALIVGNRVCEKCAHSPFNVLGAIDTRAVKMNFAICIDGDISNDLGLGFLDVFGSRRFYRKIRVVFDGLTADQEEDDQQESDIAHTRDGYGNRFAFLFLGASHCLWVFDDGDHATVGADGGEYLEIILVRSAFGCL